MKFAPLGFVPGDQSIYNGAAARSAHAQALDRYATWLAAVRRHAIPANLGAEWVAGAYTWPTLIPQYTQYIGIGVLAVGRGTLTVTADSDTYNAVKIVQIGDGKTGNLEFSNALWLWFDDPIEVTANGTDRALEASDGASPETVILTATLADHSVSEFLRVKQLLVVPLARDETAELTS